MLGRRVLLLLMVLLFLVSASFLYSTHAAGFKADLTGMVLDFPHATENGIYIHLLEEIQPGKEATYGEAILFVAKDVRILHGKETLTLMDAPLEKGQILEVKLNGPVQKSYPVQADAVTIRILPGP